MLQVKGFLVAKSLWLAAVLALWSASTLSEAANQPWKPLDSELALGNDVKCSARESVDSRYSRGIFFIDVYDIGVTHCYLTGSIHKAEEDAKKELTKNTVKKAGGTPSRVALFLSARRSTDDSIIVTGSGMVHELPQDLENGLLHAPKRIHTGVVPHFQIMPHLESIHSSKMTPETTAADISGPLVAQTSRTRPFHMEAVLPSAAPFLIRIRRWQRGCFFSPELLPELPPWADVLDFGATGDNSIAADNSVNTNATVSAKMVVLGVTSCPNVPHGLPLERLAAQIAAHTHYHVSIGLEAVLMYVRSNLLEGLVESEDVKALILAKKLFLIKWDEFAVFSTSDAQSHDWHLQRAHATLANSGIEFADLRLLFLDVNEFLVLPGQAEEKCMHGTDASTSHQVVLTAWEVTIPVPEGTGDAIFSASSLKAGQVQRACETCKPGTTMVNPNKVFGLHLADALTLDPEAHRMVPEACAFIGRITALPGSADSSFQRADTGEQAPGKRDKKAVQKFWKAGVQWALEMMMASESS